MRKIRILTVSAVFIAIIVSAVTGLTISGPNGGTVRQKAFSMSVENAPYLMRMSFNGIPIIAKSYGSFNREMLASRGINTIVVSDYTNARDTDSISFFADVPPTALKIFLFWDTDNTDLDLHVKEPNGEECYYGYRDTKLGGRLDVDVTTGYGPEIYTMEYPNTGSYEFFIHFYGGEELTEATVVAVMNEGTGREKRQTFQLMLTKAGGEIYVGKITLE